MILHKFHHLKLSLISLYFCLAVYPAIAQTKSRPLIQIDQMDYVYDAQTPGTTATRVILATDTLVAEQMKKSFLKAINNRWDAEVLNQDPEWNLKRLGIMRTLPKFKPKLKSIQPGSWHLFFQVFDNGPYSINDKYNMFTLFPSFESMDGAPYMLQIKAVLLDGANGATLFSNELQLEMKRSAFPKDQMLLRKVPGMTNSFLQAFDSAVKVFFSTSPVGLLKLPIVPAFVYVQFDSTKAKAVPLAFKVYGDTMVQEQTLRQQWVIKKIKTVKVDKQERFGSNLLGGTFTALTGIGTNRIKVRKYLAGIDYYDSYEFRPYQCKVSYFEEQTEERSRERNKNADGSSSNEINLSNKSTRRFIDTVQNAYLLSEADTVGIFKIKFGEISYFVEQFTQCWDGNDSASIVNMPEYWNNTSAVAGISMAPVYMEGTLYGKPFAIQSAKGGNQFDLMEDGQLLATLSMNGDKPSRGFLYSVPGEMRILKAMCMLASLPFRHFQ